MSHKNQGRRILTTVLSIALLVAIAFGAGETFAWVTHQLSQRNDLQSHNETVTVQETFPEPEVVPGNPVVKRVAFRNTGSVAVFLRVAYSESWENGTTLLSGSTGVTKNWTAAWSSEWELKSDGWYYYKKVLPAGASTAEVLSSVTFPADVPDGADYKLFFQVETVQCSDEAAVNTDATTKVFGRAGTVTGMTTTSNGAVNGGSVTWSGT